MASSFRLEELYEKNSYYRGRGSIIRGMDKIKKDKPDLILLDIVMPRMGGFEVMEELNKDEELKSIPVVIVSNSGQPVELDRAKRLGVKDWLIKTDFDPQEVIDKVKKQLGE